MAAANKPLSFERVGIARHFVRLIERPESQQVNELIVDWLRFGKWRGEEADALDLRKVFYLSLQLAMLSQHKEPQDAQPREAPRLGGRITEPQIDGSNGIDNGRVFRQRQT